MTPVAALRKGIRSRSWCLRTTVALRKRSVATAQPTLAFHRQRAAPRSRARTCSHAKGNRRVDHEPTGGRPETRIVRTDEPGRAPVLRARPPLGHGVAGATIGPDHVLASDDFHNSRSAGVATVATLVEIVLSGSVTERATGHLSAAAGCAERTIRRSPAVTTTQSTRLPQPWQSDRAITCDLAIAASPKRSRDTWYPDDESSRPGSGPERASRRNQGPDGGAQDRGASYAAPPRRPASAASPGPPPPHCRNWANASVRSDRRSGGRHPRSERLGGGYPRHECESPAIRAEAVL